MQNDQERMKITYSEIGRRQKKRKVEVTTLGPSTSIVEEDPGTVYVNNGNETGCSKEELQERVTSEAKKQVCILNNVFSWSLLDRSASRRATQALAELSKDEDAVSVIVDAGAIPALVKHLKEPEFVPDSEVHGGIRHFEYEVEKGSAVALGFLAIKPEYQQLIVDAGALPLLVNLLNKHNDDFNSRTLSSVIRRVADTITNLAHENNVIKSAVRCEGGIPPLVKLLDFADIKVRKSSAGALRTLAFKNDDNKNLIVQCNALPSLILMLRSEDEDIHYEAVGVIGNLVHSSPVIKKQVLREGALQPVIRLLSSACKDSQREAALLVGQFAATDSECKVHVVQRGAVYPLIDMLESLDPHLIEMSAFAIGRLAQETHNQAGIVYAGGLIPLLKLLGSKNGSLQHNAAFALYGLADNEDNVSDFIKVGAVQTLQDGDFTVQATKDCVGKTLKRLEEKINGRVLKHLLYLMSVPDIIIRRYIALSLAHLCSPEDQNTIFITNNGIELLLGLFRSTNLKQQKDASMALYKLAKKSMSVSPLDYVPPSPTTPQVYLGEKYVNSPTLSDVTFLVEGKRFFAHRIALLASSDAFRAMFDGGYREKNATDIEIPNIKWEAFELMMRFIYTGTAEITMNVAHDLLQASDQYLLEGLKRLSEYTIAQNISDDNVGSVYEISESCNALSLRHTCILFILEHFRQISAKSGYNHLIQRIIPDIRNIFTKSFKPIPIKSKITEEPPYVDNNDVIVLDI